MVSGSGVPGRRDAELVARARRGDRNARSTLVEEQMRLVHALAWRYRDLGLPLEDLAQEGVIGVLQAIERFDPESGASFATYAYWRARRAITHALTDHGRLLRLPKDVLEHRRAIAKTTGELLNAGVVPTPESIAGATGYTEAEVEQALAAPTTVTSLDASAEDEAPLEARLVDPAADDPETTVLAHHREAALHEAVVHLSARQQAVINGHFGLDGEPKTLARLGAALHVSASRVREIEREALLQLALELEPRL